MIPNLYRRLALRELADSPKAAAFGYAHVEEEGSDLRISTVLEFTRRVKREEFVMRLDYGALDIVRVEPTTCGHCGGDLSEPVEDRNCETCDQEARERGESARVDAAIDRAEAMEAYR